MMKKRMIRTVACAACLAMAFTSCGSEVPNSSGEEVVQQEEGEKMAEPGLDSAKTLTEMLGVDEDVWTAQFTFGSQSINIDAKVFVPDLDAMQVLTLEKQSMDGNGKKEILDKFCQQTYVLDEWNPPQWYIDNNIDTINSCIEIYNSGVEMDEEDIQKKIALHEAWQQQDRDFEDRISVSYEENEYYGEQDGKIYQYSFTRCSPEYLGGEELDTLTDIACFSFSPVDYSGLSHLETKKKMFCVPDDSGSETANNLCEMTEQQAEALAIDFFSQKGYSGLAVSRVMPLLWTDIASSKYCVDGYVFVLCREVDNIVLDSESTCFQCQKHGMWEDDFSKTELYWIYVTDAGVIKGSIQSPYKLKEILTEHTRLLSYQQIKQTFKALFSDDDTYYNNPNAVGSFNALRLNYYLMNDNGKYVIVPVWRLCHEEYYYNAKTKEELVGDSTSVIMLNAIDGSVIDPGDEFEE